MNTLIYQQSIIIYSTLQKNTRRRQYYIVKKYNNFQKVKLINCVGMFGI